MFECCCLVLMGICLPVLQVGFWWIYRVKCVKTTVQENITASTPVTGKRLLLLQVSVNVEINSRQLIGLIFSFTHWWKERLKPQKEGMLQAAKYMLRYHFSEVRLRSLVQFWLSISGDIFFWYLRNWHSVTFPCLVRRTGWTTVRFCFHWSMERFNISLSAWRLSCLS